MKRYLPAAIAFSLLAGQALAQNIIGGAGSGDWIATPLQSLVSVIIVGVIEIAVLATAGKCLAGNHHNAGIITAAVAAVILVKYQTVAGWFAQGLGALGVGNG
jgi:hypothetical protein